MTPTKLLELRDAARSAAELQATRRSQVKLAAELLAAADARLADAGPPFAAAIKAAGGEVFDHTTLPLVAYRSADGVTFDVVEVVAITDEVPSPDPEPAPAAG